MVLNFAEERDELLLLVIGNLRSIEAKYAPLVSNPKFWRSRLRRLWPSIAAALSSTTTQPPAQSHSVFCAPAVPNTPRLPAAMEFTPRRASIGSACAAIHAGQRRRQLRDHGNSQREEQGWSRRRRLTGPRCPAQ